MIFLFQNIFLCKRITWLGLSKYEKVKKAGLKAAKKGNSLFEHCDYNAGLYIDGCLTTLKKLRKNELYLCRVG